MCHENGKDASITTVYKDLEIKIRENFEGIWDQNVETFFWVTLKILTCMLRISV